MGAAQPIKFYESIAGSLSKPSKMPGYGYGLPALTSCKTGSKLAKIPGTSCSKCYACKGHYVMPNVVEAQAKRLESISDPLWVEAMVAMISSHREKYFRWHDSGDITSIEHLSKLVQIAVRLPEYKFWLPTQEHALVSKFRKTHGEFPPNLTVRLSVPKIDGRPLKTDLTSSSVVKHSKAAGHECPAPNQGNKCGECRACWSKEVKHVSYRQH